VGFVALGIAILTWGLREKPESGHEVSLPSLPLPARSVAIAIEARPASASIWLDDALVPNPYTAERPRDAVLHHLRVAAPGYATEEVELRLDADVRMSRSLTPLAAAPAVVSAAHLHPIANVATNVATNVTSARPAAVPAAVSAPPASCDPPYYLDARGIKKFKPECL